MENKAVSDLPISVQFDFETGEFYPFINHVLRRLSHLVPMFSDQHAVQSIIQADDRLIYDIRYYPFITSHSDMALGVTRIFPGLVGDEYHMTKGHFHEREDQPEIYFCVRGEGYLLMESLNGDFQYTSWKPGTITHIPPQYAHRVVNTGKDTLIFVASYHVSAGHNYDVVVQRGFSKILVQQDNQPVFKPNPRRG